MAFEVSRNVRVAEEVRRALSEIIRDSLSDPRVGMVTLTDVELSKDLKHARVYASVLELAAEDAATAEDSITALNHAARFLRGELGRRVKLRAIPRLRFIADNTERNAMHIESVIRGVRATDDAAARRRGEDEDGTS